MPPTPLTPRRPGVLIGGFRALSPSILGRPAILTFGCMVLCIGIMVLPRLSGLSASTPTERLSSIEVPGSLVEEDEYAFSAR